jgi:hypothetical protein
MVEHSRWWREWEVPFLAGVALAIYLPRPVYTQLGEIESLSTHVVSILAMAAVSVLIYGYSRQFLSRFGSLGAGASFATAGHLFQQGSLGTSVAIGSLLVSGSLLAWRWLDARAAPAIWTWCIGYAMAAMGMLVVGAFAPACFVAGVGLYLATTGRVRECQCWQHAAGVSVFAAVWLAGWLCGAGELFVPPTSAAARRLLAEGEGYFTHLATFPIEAAVCGLPWSILLLAYTKRSFRRTIGFASLHVWFLACSAVSACAICWLIPLAGNRSFVALYPCMAPLVGLVIQRCGDALVTASWAQMWRRYLRGMAVVMPAVGVYVFTIAVLGYGPTRGAATTAFASFYLMAALVLGSLTFWASGHSRTLHQRAAMIAIVAFLGLSYTGVISNPFAINGAQHAASDDTNAAETPSTASLDRSER